MKIYVDLTSLVQTNFITGIQRVVTEIIKRFYVKNYELEFLYYSNEHNQYLIVNGKKMYEYLNGNCSKSEIFTSKYVEIDYMEPNSLFLDLDSVWNNKLKRSYLYEKLRENNVKIAVMVYDIIPISYPQYCHNDTIFRFLNYISSVLLYADLIVTNTESTKAKLKDLIGTIGSKEVDIEVMNLGSDFVIEEQQTVTCIDEKIDKIVKKGKYLLVVGTIEPRKNHREVFETYNKYLANEDLRLIFAGRRGWNIDKFMDEMYSDPLFNKKIFHLEGLDDTHIDYLYKNAFSVVFPTYDEGYGLPIIEAIHRGTPVICSDIPVLREVGGDYCDYYKIGELSELAKKIQFYLENQNAYNQKKENLKNFKLYSWNDASDKLDSILHQYFACDIDEKEIRLSQIFILTDRIDSLIETLKYIEKNMTFINEILLCTPSSCVEQFKTVYTGALQYNIVTDEMVLGTLEKPRDHATRNFLLKSLVIRDSEFLNEDFIMSDDDYRPLFPISVENFFKDSKYQGYYCYNLKYWYGNFEEPTSYDHSMKKTFEFLSKNGMPHLQFSSHMPQVLNRSIYNELIAKYPHILYEGLDDWSVYFNYFMKVHPSCVHIDVYQTLCWPALPTDWDLYAKPKKYLFENYYSELYNDAELFSGLSKVFSSNVTSESVEKIVRYTENLSEYQLSNRVFSVGDVLHQHLYKYSVGITVVDDGEKQMIAPEFITCEMKALMELDFKILSDSIINDIEEMKVSYYFVDQDGIMGFEGEYLYQNRIPKVIKLFVPSKPDRYLLNMTFELNLKTRFECSIPVYVVM